MAKQTADTRGKQITDTRGKQIANTRGNQIADTPGMQIADTRGKQVANTRGKFCRFVFRYGSFRLSIVMYFSFMCVLVRCFVAHRRSHVDAPMDAFS